jgi:hypothetical protein
MINKEQLKAIEDNTNFFAEFTHILHVFFKELSDQFKNVKDHRRQKSVKYPPEVILFALFMKNATGIKTMRGMNRQFGKRKVRRNMEKLIGIKIKDIPSYEIINDFLKKLPPQELEKIRNDMISRLISSKDFDSLRFMGKKRIKYARKSPHWTVIFDATDISCFDKRHCEHCLTKKIKGKTIYYHNVLEAKLMLGDLVLSIGTEFIENETPDVKKQDCERNAFYRLAPKIKKAFKDLPICILADSLYACGPVFKICNSYKWGFIIRFKRGSIRTLGRKFDDFIENNNENTLSKSGTLKKNETVYWQSNIDYQEVKVDIFEMQINLPDEKIQRFTFLSNIEVDRTNIIQMIKEGRKRWKIENEGFNRQKNHQYFIQHLNSQNPNAQKNHYLMVQITDIVMQLYGKGAEIFKILKKTIQEKSSDLLGAFQWQTLTEEDLTNNTKSKKIKIS